MVLDRSDTAVTGQAVSGDTGHLLDLRRFQDIVDEARRLIPRYCPEWTDHNVSDPGITLIELFAWMTEMTLYQINRVPDSMYERFLDLIGVQREPARPARVETTFYLSAPLARPVTIPEGTEVSSVMDEDGRGTEVFTTLTPVTVRPPALVAVRTWRQGRGYEDYLPYLTSALVRAPVFSDPPVPEDALHLGFEGDLAGYSLQLSLDCAESGATHIDPLRPPLAWEYWSGEQGNWALLPVLAPSANGEARDALDGDPTRGLNQSGAVYVHIPVDSAPFEVDGATATWVRVRYVASEEQRYDASPVVTGVRPFAIAASGPAEHAVTHRAEVLGESSGESGQRFTLLQAPVLRGTVPHLIEERLGDDVRVWEEVADFSGSGETDSHFVIDYLRGTVEFGPFVREPDGGGRRYGLAPRRGASLVMRDYRVGGGVRGNIGAHVLSTLRTTVPYVATVTNHRRARGGEDAETLEHARMRARSALRASESLVTADDYQRQAMSVAGVAKALAREGRSAGSVELVVVPSVGDSVVRLDAQALTPSPELFAALSERLDERKVLGTRIEYRGPAVRAIEVDAEVHVTPGQNPALVRAHVEERVRRFFDPAVGGVYGTGAPFGMAVTESLIAGLVQSVDGVLYVERVRLSDAGEGELTRAEAPADGLLVLGRLYVGTEED